MPATRSLTDKGSAILAVRLSLVVVSTPFRVCSTNSSLTPIISLQYTKTLESSFDGAHTIHSYDRTSYKLYSKSNLRQTRLAHPLFL